VGFDGVWFIGYIFIPHAGKIGIHITVMIAVIIWLKNVSFVVSFLKIPTNATDSNFMNSHWARTETGTLMHSECNVRARSHA
jgi:hypothetical protein